MLKTLLVLALCAAGSGTVLGATLQQWRSRTVYQVITDRFASTDGWGQSCSNVKQYCGGTFRGLVTRQSYIEDLGFDAIWMSPIPVQGSEMMGNDAYHGYWPADFYRVNPSFGSEEDLQALLQAYHNKGMYVMFDLVINHVGYGDYTTFNPFNASEHFHDCEGCFGLYCEVGPGNPFASPKAAHANEHCKLSGLPDLNHTSPRVLELMKGVFDHTVSTYSPDGLRLDAAGHSDMAFCGALAAHVPNTWTVGELFFVDNVSQSMEAHADYLVKAAPSSVFAFPMAIAIQKTLREYSNDMVWFAQRRAEWLALMGDRVHGMMTFLDNHDLPRWLHPRYSSISRFKNALAYILFTEGVPVIYYGTEQGFEQIPAEGPPGSPPADSRQPLWHSEYSHDHPLWLFLRISIAYRKEARVWDAGIAQQHHVDNTTLVLSRGHFVLVLTSVPEWDARNRSPADVVTLQGLLPARFRAKTLSNIYNPEDKMRVSSGGLGLYTPDPHGAPQVFYFGDVAPPSSFYKPARKARETASSAVFVSFLVAYALLPLALLYVRMLQKSNTAGTADAAPTCLGVASAGTDSSNSGSTRQPSNTVTVLIPALSGSLSRLSLTSALGMGVSPAACRQASSTPNSSAQVSRGNSAQALLQAANLTRAAACQAAGGTTSTMQAVNADSATSSACAAALPAATAGKTSRLASTVSSSPQVRALVSRLPSASQSPARPGITPMAAPAATSSSSLRSLIGVSTAGASTSTLSMSTSGRQSPPVGISLSHFGPKVPPGLGRVQNPVTVQPTVASAAEEVHASFDWSFTTSPCSNSGSDDFRGYVAFQEEVESFLSDSSSDAGCSCPDQEPSWAVFDTTVSTGGVRSPFASAPRQVEASADDCTSAGQCAAAGPAAFDPKSSAVLHVALEYSLPHLGLNNQLMYGGMGLVVDTFLQHWPGPLALCAPLYKPCYEGAEGNASADRPFFVPSGQSPLLALTVDVARGWQLPVEVYKVTAQVQQGPAAGQDRTYYLIQSELFRHRSRSGLYSFCDESEMLTWLAVFNKAVAAVVLAEGYQHVQLHDYHGALSLMYMPKELWPAVVYVAHNAHYDARFPIPTAARKQQVYELLNLTPDASTYVEHNGCVDILRPAVVHMRMCQQGRGVIAVSPRYASQVSKKLSCFWSLSPVGRPHSIIGILNSLDMKDSLAAAGLPFEEVLSIKAAAKERLQLQYGLSVGQQYSLATFVGHMTQQKGCDIIAEVAQELMDRHPYLQLVVVGPAGDPVGSAASKRLYKLSAQYPDRMYCPVDHYVAGQEKELLLQATDFCLLPSRFEPCGLVDVEFGWNGSVIIGHDTGGLGKMPGVYFTAQASHLEHLSRKFEEAMDTALALPVTERQLRMAAALAQRFPVPEMMDKYAAAWKEVVVSFNSTKLSGVPAQRRKSRQASFFADKWSRCNQQGNSTTGTNTSASTAAATALAAIPSGQADPSNAGAPTTDSSSAGTRDICIDVAGPNGSVPKSVTANPNAVSTAQHVTNRLMVVLQPLSLGPGILLLSFLLLQEVLVGSKHVVGMKLQDWVWAAMPHHVAMMAPLVVTCLTLSALAAPLWFWLATVLRPASYIRMATVLVSVSYALSFIALHLTQLISIAVGLTAITNLVTCPFLSLGMMGDEDVDVFKVGRSMLALSEVTKYGLLTVCLTMASTATGPLPHQVVAGILLLASGGITLWMFGPNALTDAYHHMSLSMKGQRRFLVHLSCFWLSLAAGACDSLSMLLTGFLVVNLTRDLGMLAVFQAIAFGCSAAAVLWNWQALCSRLAELHLNKAVLLLAGLPFYQASKAGVLMAKLPMGVMLPICAALDVLMGGRSSIVGLAGFVTLPSREIVAVWQFAGIMTGSASGIALLGGACSGIQSGITISSWVLFYTIAVLEVMRAAVMLLFAQSYADENLSAP